MRKYLDKIKKYWDKLTLASKIVFILWTFISLSDLFSGKINSTFIQWLILFLFGYFLFVGITQLISNRKTRKDKTKLKSLSPTDSLPIITSSNLLLSSGETCHYCEPATFVKTKNVVVGYSGGHSGVSIRVAKGMSYRVGATKAAPVRGDVQERASGILSITNKRVVFSSNKGAFDKKISSLSSVTPYSDGIAFQFGSQQYPLETKNSSYIYQILARIVNMSDEEVSGVNE